MNSRHRQGHGLVAGACRGAVILPTEGDAALVEGEQPRVGDRHPVRVAGQIGEHRSPARRRGAWHRRPIRTSRSGASQAAKAPASVSQANSPKNCSRPVRCRPWPVPRGSDGGTDRDSTRTGRKKPGRHGTQRSPSAGPGHRLARCRAHAGWCVSADPQVCRTRVTPILRAQMLGIGGDGAQRLGGELEQQVVDHRPCWSRRWR